MADVKEMNAEYVQKHKDRLQMAIDTYTRFQKLFDNKLFTEYMDLFAQKTRKYKELRADVPRLGAVRYSEQVSRDAKGQIVAKTKVPEKTTEADQIAHIQQFNWRINEIELLHRLPEDLARGAQRAKKELEIIEEREKNAKTFKK